MTPLTDRAGRPRILLAATLRWPFASRLALAFRALGCEVQAWCPAGNPLEKICGAAHLHRGAVLWRLPSLRAAIAAAAPDLIVPCDDAAALALHSLHEPAAGSPAAVRRLIERSLGRPAAVALATTRGELMRLALAEGVRVPETMRIDGPRDLDVWAGRNGFPAVLKLDGSFGGLGVTVVRDLAQAHAAWLAATRPSLLDALSDLILRRDPAPLLRALSAAAPVVTLQRYIVGTAANRAVACCQGEVLAGTSVVALQTRSPTGPATVVRVVDDAEMAEAARRMVLALGLSGFCGLDFIIEAGTGAAWMIEINPRATPISHLALGPGHDLPSTLFWRLRGEWPAEAAAPGSDETIALFPGEWQRDPLSPFLHTALHDVPWGQIELVLDGLDRPWEDRGYVARLRAALSPGHRAPVRATLAAGPAAPGTRAGAA